MIKICNFEGCRKEFEGKSNQKYCSVKCRDNQRLIRDKNKYVYICEICGKEVYNYHKRRSYMHTFCSKKCQIHPVLIKSVV